MKTIKIIGIWFLAFLVTLGAAVFQRMTGPTYPFKETVELNEKEYRLKLPRSLETGGKSFIELPVSDEKVSGTISYRIYPTNEPFCIDTLEHAGKGLVALLPEQKAAGKIEYKIELTDGNTSYESPFLLLRYKNPVPAGWLVPHITLMFLAMLLAVAAGLMAAFNYGKYSRTFLWGGILLFLGGFVFGPAVQKFAFGEFWTGVPFGWDLTDNKTLLVMLVFIFVLFKNYKKPSRIWTLIAVLALLLVYSIPHSVLGSELDPKTGEITQGLK